MTVRGLRTAIGVLLALAFAVTAPLAVAASWAKTQVDDTDAYVANVGELSDDPVVRREVGEQLTRVLTAQLQVGEVPGASDVIGAVVDQVLDSDDFPTVWEEANRTAHEQIVAILRGDATAADGDVEISLADLYNLAAERMRAEGLPVADRPEGSLTFRTAPPQRLEDAQGAYQGLVAAGTWLPVLALVLLVGAIAVPAGRSRLTALLVGALGTIITTGLLLVAVAAGSEIAGLQVRGEDRALATAVIDALLDSLRDRAWIVIVVALLAFVGSIVALVVTGRAARRRPRTTLPPPA